MAESTRTDAVMALFAAHAAEIAARFDRALESSGFDRVIVYAGDEIMRDRDDIAYPFAAEPYFKLWAPLQTAPGSAVTYTPGERPRLVHFEDTSFWHEPPSSPSGDWVGQFELRCVQTTTERDASLATGSGRCAAIGAPGTAWLDGVVPNDSSLLTALDFDRARKTPYEAACIAQANEIAARGHATAQRLFHEDASEFAINHAYCESTQQRETELPYGNIVAFNEQAAVLHYQNLRHDPPGAPSSFLLDAGATFNGYASDITRTIARESEAMSDLIAAVDSLQRRVCSEIRAGVDWVDLHERAHVLVAEVLDDHGLVTCSATEAYARGITRYFLPHGLGHLLGLQVHDAGGRLIDASGTLRAPPDAHPMLRLTRVLEHGFVVTVEPGIYFIPSLLDELRSSDLSDAIAWSTVESFAPFGGVRIEDDVLVTDDGCINLSRPALESVNVW